MGRIGQIGLIGNLSYKSYLSYTSHSSYQICVKALRDASIVRSMISSVCAVEMKAASNCDGARYTPSSSMAWKNRAKPWRSLRLAVSQSRTGSEVKKVEIGRASCRE